MGIDGFFLFFLGKLLLSLCWSSQIGGMNSLFRLYLVSLLFFFLVTFPFLKANYMIKMFSEKQENLLFIM